MLSLASVTSAQELPKPGKQHEYLKRLVGSWEAESDAGKGTMNYKMELGGLWLVGDFDGEFGGFKFQGKGLDTYDPATKKFRNVWIDSFSTAARSMEGTMDKDEKVLTMTGDGRGPDGKTIKFKSVMEMKNADTISYGLFMIGDDGKDQQMVNITYKRKK